MTVMLLATASEYFHYGIAGGGVYDWRLYDTHYTERFMLTPEENPEGYRNSAVINKVSGYKGDESTMLRLSHGTADDNVHFQNTLQLADTLQRQNSRFELMVYPDGKHGYRGAQGVHYRDYNRDFWLEKLTR